MTLERAKVLGIQQGSVALSRYLLLGDGRRPSLSRLNDLFAPYQAAPVSLEGVRKEEICGWVRPVGIEGVKVDLPPDHVWDLSDCQIDDGLLLRLRIERRKVPAPLLQLIYKQRFFDISAKTGKTPGPKERRDLRDEVKAELMARALPALSYVDAFWRDGSGELMLFSTSKKARTLFEGLFGATFAEPLQLQLVPLEPPLIGLKHADWQDSQVASEAVSRLSLATPVAFAEQTPS